MTDDLVKRLRVCANDQGGWMYGEAATCIEKLTDRMQSSERVLNKVANGDLRLAKTMGAKVRYSPADDRLVERVRKMEDALRSIADTPIGAEIPDRTTIWGLAKHMQETARDALKEGKDEQ